MLLSRFWVPSDLRYAGLSFPVNMAFSARDMIKESNAWGCTVWVLFFRGMIPASELLVWVWKTMRYPFLPAPQPAQILWRGSRLYHGVCTQRWGRCQSLEGCDRKPKVPFSPLCPALQRSCLPAAAHRRMFLRPYLPYGFQLG